jgi:hypothetical protein
MMKIYLILEEIICGFCRVSFKTGKTPYGNSKLLY